MDMVSLFGYFSLSLFLGGVVALISGGIVYFAGPRKRTNIFWMLLNLSTATWSFGYFSMITLGNVGYAHISNLILHYGAILIPIFYLLFVLHITGYYKKFKA